MSTTQPRRPAGVPTGGQFASKSRPTPGYTLDDTEVCDECGAEMPEGFGAGAEHDRSCSLHPDSVDNSPGRATIDGRPVEPKVQAWDDGCRSESYSRDGQLHDPDDGRPAVVWYRQDGTVERELHYSKDQLSDPDDGRPAFVDYYPDGTVEREVHHSEGQRHDPDDGRPAFVNYYPDGTVRSEQHWYEGVRQD